MHRTETIDYVIVISGEIKMEMDDSTVKLNQGDGAKGNESRLGQSERLDRAGRLCPCRRAAAWDWASGYAVGNRRLMSSAWSADVVQRTFRRKDELREPVADGDQGLVAVFAVIAERWRRAIGALPRIALSPAVRRGGACGSIDAV